MRKSLFFVGAACLAFGPIAYDKLAYNEDQQLKSHETPECVVFSKIESPEFNVIPKRYKHEDKTKFYELRESCELSIQN